MTKTKAIYSDRDYLEARFSSTDEKLDKILEVVERQGNRIEQLELDVGGAKMLGKAAIGVAAICGGVVTWVLNISEKLLPHVNR